jgi:hypothetical protein
MKSWFAKLRARAALDAGGPRRVSQQELAAVDQALRQSLPRAHPPANLHSSIMRAVHSAQQRPARPLWLTLLRWLPATAVPVLALAVAWHVLRSHQSSSAANAQSLAAAATALEVGGQLAHTAPSAAVAPLSEELARLNLDLDNTAQFLLASLP